jgi:hypothetical protein
MKGNIMPSIKGKTFDQPTKPVPPADPIAEAKALVAEDFDHFSQAGDSRPQRSP